MTDIGTLNFLWSQTLIAGFVAAGVRQAVISPGSRSTPLALAMLRQPGLSCHVTVDERSAAFFALGIAKASRRPVMLLATSGSAPANWLPAIVEASQAATPLIAISADRPPELQDCGANQTIDQVGLFGPHVRASHAPGAPFAEFDPAWLHHLAAQACEQATWPHPGPVHINQPFREPLLPAKELPPPARPAVIRSGAGPQVPDREAIDALARSLSGRPGIIVCGELPAQAGFAAAVTELAAKLACPILAEPLSGLRFGAHDRVRICVRYNAWLGSPDAAAGLRPEWILRFGNAPVTRKLQNYLDSAGAAVHAVVDPLPRWSDPARRLTHLLRADPLLACHALLATNPAPASGEWQAGFAARETVVPDTGNAWHIPPLADELPAGYAVFIGNSLAIRQFDTHSGSADRELSLFANRGASGIDGNISTALGIAVEHGRVLALLGDLTCQHDLGGLALARGRDAIIVAVNNGGGGIFEQLPQATLPEFDLGWRTPQQFDFADAAGAFGIAHARAAGVDELRRALRHAIAVGGPHLIEVLAG
jgi:2-succinyl-5-enolpyruvyl-6-hydroxy-3-cyclohexene-1-carboxylate synthase